MKITTVEAGAPAEEAQLASQLTGPELDEVREHVRQRIVDAGEEPSLLLGSVLREVRARPIEDGLALDDVGAVLSRMRAADDYWYLFREPNYPGTLSPSETGSESVPDSFEENRRRALEQYGWREIDGLTCENRLAQARINAQAEARFKATVGTSPTALPGGLIAPRDSERLRGADRLTEARRMDRLGGRVDAGRASGPVAEPPRPESDPLARLAAARRAAR